MPNNRIDSFTETPMSDSSFYKKLVAAKLNESKKLAASIC